MSKQRLAQHFILLTCLLLAACGGGGGGGGGSGGGGSSPPPPSAASQWPGMFAVSFPENGTSQIATAATFKMYAPTEEMPTNVALSGADAVSFQVEIQASSTADASGSRDVTVRVRSIASRPFNFERPTDSDKDNVYSFQLTGQFRGENLSSQIRVTITDLPDGAEKPMRYLVGEATGQDIGPLMSALPDLTGDGKAELGVSVRTGKGSASAYVVTSEAIAGLTPATTTIAQASATGTRFTDRTVSGAAEYNMISADAGSRSVLLSDYGEKKLFLYAGVDSTAYAALRGNIDPTGLAAAPIVYDSPDGNPIEGQILGDVNGDGLADIFVRSVGPPQTIPAGTVFGIVFGRAVTSPADRQRVATPDIRFSAQLLAPGPWGDFSATQLTARLVADTDGDGARDLLMFAPYNGQGICGGSRAWFVRSAFLKTASAGVIDISAAPTTTAGFTISGWYLADVIEGADFDGDGHPTLFFVSTQNALFPIDANDLGTFTPAYPCATTFASPFDPSRWAAGATHMSVSVGDVDGDGLSDIFTAASDGAKIVRGSEIKRAQTDSTFNATLQKDLPIKFVPGQECYGMFMSGAPIWLAGLDVVAAPVCTSDGKGKIVLVNLADVRETIAKGLPSLSLYTE